MKKSIWKGISQFFAAVLFALTLIFGVAFWQTPIQDASASSGKLVVNKTKFVEGESIWVAAEGSGKDWVGLYRNGESMSALWGYVTDFGSATAFDMLQAPFNNTSNGISATISAGDYTLALIPNDLGGIENAIETIDITVVSKTTPDMWVDQTQFLIDQPVYVTATGSNQNWIGIYRQGESSYARWYYVKDYAGVTFNMQNGTPNINASFSPNLTRGYYTLMFFEKDDSVLPLKTLQIEIVGDPTIPADPVSATYQLDNNTNGYATGTITVTVDKADTQNRSIVMMWADANGALTDYTPMQFKVTGETSSFTFGKHVVIPAGATRLLVYTKNAKGDALSQNAISIALPQGAASKTPLSTTADQTLWVVSDIHIDEQTDHTHNQNFTNMLGDTARIDSNALGLFVVGDIANHGKDQEFINMQARYDAVSNALPMYLAIGNHDYYGYLGDTNQFNYATNRFLQYAKLPTGGNPTSTNYDFWLGGYHFIFLGTDEIPPYGVHCTLSDSTLAWLDTKLDEKQNANDTTNRPTFLFLHQSMYNTVSGGLPGEGYDGVTDEYKLRAVLADHPEVMLFNGHSHWTMDSVGNMYEGTEDLPVRAFNCASTAYLWTTYDNLNGDNLAGSQGYYVRVYGDYLYVLGYDFIADKWISAAQYCIELNPAQDTHTCEDTDNNHNCDTCGEVLTSCEDTDNDHLCDTCTTKLSDCEDTDNNHLCDTCTTKLSDCKDTNNDHNCDTCGEALTSCKDNDSDHNCDTCGEKLSDCEDTDSDGACDTCGEPVQNAGGNEGSEGGTGGSEPEPSAPTKAGCFSSIGGTSIGVTAAAVALALIRKKRRK